MPLMTFNTRMDASSSFLLRQAYITAHAHHQHHSPIYCVLSFLFFFYNFELIRVLLTIDQAF